MIDDFDFTTLPDADDAPVVEPSREPDSHEDADHDDADQDDALIAVNSPAVTL